MFSFFRFSLVLLLVASSVYIFSMASAVTVTELSAELNATVALSPETIVLEKKLEIEQESISELLIAQVSPQESIQSEKDEIDLSGFPPCDSPACQSVAIKAVWPESQIEFSQENMVRFKFRGFNLSVPKSAIKTRENNSFGQFDFEDKRWISMTIFERSDMDEFFKASNYTMSDWADIVFNQTPDSKKPITENEAYAWYASLMNKVAFVGGNMVAHYQKNPINVYTINEFYTGKVIFMIVSHDLPNVLLKMEAYGFEPDEIKQLIAGIEK